MNPGRISRLVFGNEEEVYVAQKVFVAGMTQLHLLIYLEGRCELEVPRIHRLGQMAAGEDEELLGAAWCRTQLFEDRLSRAAGNVAGADVCGAVPKMFGILGRGNRNCPVEERFEF